MALTKMACASMTLLVLSVAPMRAQHGPMFTPGETGNRYHLCYAVEAGGRPIRIPGADLSCLTREFAREDCEGSLRVSGEQTLNRGACLDFHQHHVRLRPVAPIATR